MKNNILKLIYLLTLIFLYYLITPYNYFIFLVLGLLYIIFSNILNLITLNNDKTLFIPTIKSLTLLNTFFVLINLIIGIILNKIFYLHNTIEILLILSLSYPLKSLLNIISEYLKLNHYKKLSNLIPLFFPYLNIFIFLISYYFSIIVLTINLNIAIIITLLSLIVTNYLLIILLLIFIKKKVPNSNLFSKYSYHKILNTLKKQYPKYLIYNYNYFLIYISTVYLFYLLINRYYFSYITTSNLLTKYYLYFFLLNYFINNFIITTKNNTYFKIIFIIILLSFSLINLTILNHLNIITIFLSIELLLTILYYILTTKTPSPNKLVKYLILSLIAKIIISPITIEFIYVIGYNPLIGNIISTIICYLSILIPNYLTNYSHQQVRLKQNSCYNQKKVV